LIIGVKVSSLLNIIFTVLNLIIILIIVIAGLTKANFNYWSLKPDVNFLEIYFLHHNEFLMIKKIKNNTNWDDIDGNYQTCDSSDRCGNGGI